MAQRCSLRYPLTMHADKKAPPTSLTREAILKALEILSDRLGRSGGTGDWLNDGAKGFISARHETTLEICPSSHI